VIVENPTWSSYNEQWHAVLDCFFWTSRLRRGSRDTVPTVIAFPSPDPRHDHRGVRIDLQMTGIDALPPTESLWRPLRLRMKVWALKRADWQQAVQTALMVPAEMPDVLPIDLFAHLERCKRVALSCARRVLGESSPEGKCGGSFRAILMQRGISWAASNSSK
jgi:hypothetical protein